MFKHGRLRKFNRTPSTIYIYNTSFILFFAFFVQIYLYLDGDTHIETRTKYLSI